VMWSGRVWVPPDAETVLEELAVHDPRIRKRGTSTIETIRRIGSDEYNASSWANYFETNPADLERELLELNRRDVIGLAAWRFAIHLECVPAVSPNWSNIEKRCAARMETVSRLSKAAKAYAKQDKICRRAQLLRYLGLDAPDHCGRCDVCDPDLPRPWTSRSLKVESLREALPAEAVIRAMLYDVGGRFSQRSIAHALAGSTGGGKYPISAFLQEHRLFGYLASLEVSGVETAVESLVSVGQVESIMVERVGSNAYPSWKLTAAGSALT